MSRGGINNKGGRPKGSKAAHTLDAQAGKALLIAMYLENIKPINEALLAKAKSGDLLAIKELHDRVYGRSLQPITADVKGTLAISFDPTFNASSDSSR